MRRFYRPAVPGGTVHIAPGAAHHIENTGSTVLRFLCCCSPAYRYEDTELIEST
jgi:mannose-6-phosphate isomerase-like protein (cupin superfamily)